MNGTRQSKIRQALGVIQSCRHVPTGWRSRELLGRLLTVSIETGPNGGLA
jgi:hypothetical protein